MQTLHYRPQEAYMKFQVTLLSCEGILIHDNSVVSVCTCLELTGTQHGQSDCLRWVWANNPFTNGLRRQCSTKLLYKPMSSWCWDLYSTKNLCYIVRNLAQIHGIWQCGALKVADFCNVMCDKILKSNTRYPQGHMDLPKKLQLPDLRHTFQIKASCSDLF